MTSVEGLKLALAGKLRAQILQKRGAVPVALSPQEYYQAIQRNVVDGLATALVAVIAVKLDELIHYYQTGPYGGAIVMIVMNESVYEKLPPDAKKAIDDNSGLVGTRWISEFMTDHENNDWKRLGAIAGNTVERANEATLAAWKPAFEWAEQSWSSEVPNGAQILSDVRNAIAAAKAK